MPVVHEYGGAVTVLAQENINMGAAFLRHAIPVLVVALALLVGTGGDSVPRVSAAAAVIDPTSCGGTAVPNSYCSFLLDGSDVVIGANSCNIEWSCISLGNGSTIGDNSCNFAYACSYVMGTIGDNSCNGENACNTTGWSGSSTIGDNSCNGKNACYYAGAYGGSSIIGDYSCNYDNTGFSGTYRPQCAQQNASVGDCEYNDSAATACSDDDGDGVPGYLDLCPGTPEGATVDEDGCPPDEDDDGVPDYLDLCSGTNQNAEVISQGCSLAQLTPIACATMRFTSVIFGTEDADTLTGTSGSDFILALGGEDRVSSNGGNDCIVGGPGADVLDGGAGNDLIFGNEGDDTLSGGSGNDRLYGGDGEDTLLGGNDNDRLYGGDDNDTLNGGNGNDQLTGEGGTDSLNGGTGTDSCSALDAGGTRVQCEAAFVGP